MAGMGDWQAVGKHRMRIQGDVVFAQIQGEITGDEVVTLLEHMQKVEREYGYVFEIVDASVSGSMSAEARRQNAQWHLQHVLQIELVVFGAGLLMRTMMTLLINAVRLLGRRQIAPNFAANEAEAWAWVERRRAELQAQKGPAQGTR